MYINIATLNKISKTGLSLLSDRYALTDTIEEAKGILVRSQDMNSMELSENLEAIARAGAGVNNIPLDRCAEKGIVVFNTPGANANAVKELVLAGLLLSARNIPRALSWASSLTENVSAAVEKRQVSVCRQRNFRQDPRSSRPWSHRQKSSKLSPCPGNEHRRLRSLFQRRYGKVAIYSDLKDLLPLCDYVTIHVPASDSTKGMFNDQLFS